MVSDEDEAFGQAQPRREEEKVEEEVADPVDLLGGDVIQPRTTKEKKVKQQSPEKQPAEPNLMGDDILSLGFDQPAQEPAPAQQKAAPTMMGLMAPPSKGGNPSQPTTSSNEPNLLEFDIMGNSTPQPQTAQTTSTGGANFLELG